MQRQVNIRVHAEKSYQIKPKSDCIYHALIDLEQQTDVCLVGNQSENDKYNLIAVQFNKISLRVCPLRVCSQQKCTKNKSIPVGLIVGDTQPYLTSDRKPGNMQLLY